MNRIIYRALLTSCTLLATATSIYFFLQKRPQKITETSFAKASPSPINSLPSNQSISIIEPGNYTAQTFDLVGKLKGLSKKQIDEHEQLYKGYVNSRNKISLELQKVDRSSPSRTWSPFRELKIEETYAINGQILHELYFENLEQPGIEMGPQMKALIESNFGSIEKFKKDFMDCGNVSRGWVVTAFSFDDGRLHNFVLEQHNQNVPVLMIPLLVLDVYEHAYMIDYGIKRAPYLDVFWKNINWNVVENRINRWVNKIR